MNSTQLTKRRARVSEISLPLIPHSWPADDWPDGTFPNSTEAARYLLRAHRAELTACGALGRVGRRLVVFGQPFAAWLASSRARVSNFEVAANRARSTATRDDAGDAALAEGEAA